MRTMTTMMKVVMKIIMTMIMMMVVMKMVMKMMSPAAVSHSPVDCGPHKCSAVIRF